MDEMGINKPLFRLYAKANISQRVYSAISGKREERISVISACCNNQLVAPLVFSGYTDTLLVIYWVKEVLIPELRSGQVVVFDNASYHKSSEITELIESVGCKVIYLPPYSPDLNKIEKYWANLKRKLRELWNDQLDVMENIVEAIRMSNFRLG